MKNFKRILAIVLVVMMVVPMMTTGLYAATAEDVQVKAADGVTFAGGNWKAYGYNDWSDHMGESLASFDDLVQYTVDAEGQICLYNAVQKLGSYGYGWFNLNPINVLQSTNTTAIDGLYFRLGMMPSGVSSGTYAEQISYAFSENQLLGSISPDVYTKADGFATANGMVTDGLVITMVNTDGDIANQNAVFNTITAYVMDNGEVVSSQSFDTDNQGLDFGLCIGHGHNTFISFADGVVTFHVEDTYSANGAYINQTYTFDTLDTSTLSTYKDYYFAVGSKGEADKTTNDFDGSVNLNLARVSTFTIDETGLYTAVTQDNKNFADWTGHGEVNCAHDTWSDWTETTAPTCDTTGVQERVCQGCGKVEFSTIAALGHTWGEWNVDAAATCTETGSQSRVCSVCGDTETATIAATGHDWSEWYTTAEPDCTNDGMEQRDCGVCGSYEENVLSALGHTWVWDTLPTATVDGARHCDACGTVESDLAYDYTYYWTPASNNKIGTVDEGYADYNDQYDVAVDGTITMKDLSLAYAGPYNYNVLLKLTSEFKSSLPGFTATVDTLEDNNIGTSLEKEYPTVLSFMWTNAKENYDGATEFSAYTGLEGGDTRASSRYGHVWNNYVAGEYSLNVVLSDGSLFWGSTWYGELDDGEYDWLYYTVVSGGNYWTTKMVQLSPVVSAYEPVTVSIFTEYNETSGKLGVYCDINGNLMELTEAAGSQLGTQDYYFSVAAYADGANASTASFELTDVCGEAPATFAGYAHEHSYYYDKAATCVADGYSMCMECMEVVATIPATGEHDWTDATCTVAKTCSVCGATEGEPAGHTYVDFYCSVCSVAEGAAYIENESGKTLYADLQSALTAAVSMDKVVLLKNCVNDAAAFTVGVQQNIDIDLNGFTLRNKAGDALVIDSANVFIFGTNGGTIRSSDGIAIVVKNGGNANIFDAITVRCSSEEGFNVFSLDETSTAKIYALGGRYYKDPTACGVTLDDGLSISGEGTNWTVIETPAECTHVWGDWVVTLEPTETTDGSQTRTCTICGAEETEAIPATGVVEPEVKDWLITFDPVDGTMPEGVELSYGINTGDNYKEATGIEYPVPTAAEAGMVFAGWYWDVYDFTLTKGDWDSGSFAVSQNVDLIALYEECTHANWSEWTTTTEPSYDAEGEQTRTCADCGTVETQAIDKLLRDWVLSFDPVDGTMPEGVPTEMRINTNDNYKTATGYDYPVPTLDGYVFTGWYWDVYNFILDEGTWNGGYFAVSQDVALVALWEEAPAPVEVAVVAEGNTINVTNIGDTVKDVWVAEGEVSTYADVKAAKLYMLPGNSYKVVDGAWSYDVAENGIYTVMIRYNDGTTETKYIVVECNDGLVPDMVQDGATITFNNLENLYVLRYVAGEYDSSYAIKRADGVVNVSPKHDSEKFVNNSFSVTLEPGTYSFVTQFNDGNYVYYTVVVEAPKKDYVITFDAGEGTMPEGVATEYGINYNENYKEATGIDYPVPTAPEGMTFAGWYWELYNYVLDEGTWNGGYYAVQMNVDLIALYE